MVTRMYFSFNFRKLFTIILQIFYFLYMEVDLSSSATHNWWNLLLLILTSLLFCFIFSNFYIFLVTFRIVLMYNFEGFLGSSVGKESACYAGDPGSIPGSGRSTGEGIGCPLQYAGAFLVAQLVKNPLAMWETWVWSLGWEDPLEKGTATHSSILAWRIQWTV